MKVWITGANRSLGKYLRDHFDIRGHTTSSISRPKFDLNYALDIVRDMTLDHLAKYGCPDVFIHNSGVTECSSIEDLSPWSLQRIMHINLLAPAMINSALVSFHRDDDPPLRIIHIASIGARKAFRYSLAYCMSKAGLVMMTKQLAKELTGRKPGIFVYAVSPHGIDGTDMIGESLQSLVDTRGMTYEEAKEYNCKSPMGRLGTREEVAKVVYWVATDAPEYMTGENIEFPGGMGV